ncbi:MAG: hypothetical protein A2017_10010 [Lentisphaerae bacterium GWF2_44_16]|nr:MAG: hypothetical protein A2017_10010 [Lentisphaerae bacterium GWF2_44_16]
MFTGDIKTASPFRDLFPISDKIVKELYWDMQKNGFDESKPIVLWKSHDSIVIDGHTRLRAANKAGLLQIPVVLKDFADEKAALEYAIKCQRNRRNLTDREIIKCIAELDKRKDKNANLRQGISEAPCGVSGKTASETAALLGINHRKVERARTVMDNAPEEIKEAVKTGQMTINLAYNKTVKPQKGSKESLELAAEEIEKIDKVFEIIKERLNENQVRELIKRLVKEICH